MGCAFQITNERGCGLLPQFLLEEEASLLRVSEHEAVSVPMIASKILGAWGLYTRREWVPAPQEEVAAGHVVGELLVELEESIVLGRVGSQ